MATVIFENMIRALQEQSDAHIEALHGTLAQHSTWLSAVVADTWVVLNGVGNTEPTVSISRPPMAVDATASVIVEKENVATVANVSPPKPPAPLCPAVVDALPGTSTSKFGGIGQSRPPMNKRKAVDKGAPTAVAPVRNEVSIALPAEDSGVFDAAYAAALAEIESRGLRVVDLKKELASLSLPQSGVKSELMHRLATANAQRAVATAASKPAVIDVTSPPNAPVAVPPPSPEMPQDVIGVVPDDDDFKDAPTFVEPTVSVEPLQKPPNSSVVSQLRRPPMLPPKSKRPLGIASGAADIRTSKRPASVLASVSQPVAVPPIATEDSTAATAQVTLDAEKQRKEAEERERLRVEAEEISRQAAIAAEAKRQAEVVAEAKRLAELEEAARQAAIMEEARRQAELAAEAKRQAEVAQAKRESEAAAAKRQAEEAEQRAAAARKAEQDRLKAEQSARQEAERKKMMELAENVKRLEELARKRDEERKRLGTPLGKLGPSSALKVAIPSLPAQQTVPTTQTIAAKLPPLPPSPAESESAQVAPAASTVIEFQPSTVILDPQPPLRPLSTESITALWSQHIDEALCAPTPTSNTSKSSISSVVDNTPLASMKTPAKDEDEVMDVSVTPLTVSAKKPTIVQLPSSVKIATPTPTATQTPTPTPTPTPKKITPPVPQFSAAKPLTPKAPQAAPANPVFNNYELSDKETDTEDESDEENARTKNGKRIADWARPDALEAALKRQFGGAEPIDPEAIFGEIPLCDLEQIFERKKTNRNKVYRSRSSSGNWLKDKLTDKEKVVYAKTMGLPA